MNDKPIIQGNNMYDNPSQPLKHSAIWLNFRADCNSSLLSGYLAGKHEREESNAYDLKQYVMPDGNISGKALSEALFPTYEMGYFLSHSHDDAEFARKVAHRLQKMGKSVFYDEDFWQSADELIKTLNSRDSKQTCSCGREYYDLGACLKNASSAYVLLCAALQEVITKAHTFIFIGTQASIYSETNQTTFIPLVVF